MNMNFKNILGKLSIFLLVLFSAIFVYAAGIKAGILALVFKVISGNNEELTLASIKGKIAVIFYETKDAVEENRQLKDELNKFYVAQSDHVKNLILRIPIINCKGVFFTDIWKNNLKESSKKESMVIYGDWDGKMFSSYGIKDKESNLIIIGRDGIVKYAFAGKVEEKEFGRIKDLLIAEAN